ncbi:hypothetical protein C8J56DRAFT_921580, partial [Mycena floridula]
MRRMGMRYICLVYSFSTSICSVSLPFTSSLRVPSQICAACIKANRDCIVQDDRLRCQGCIEHRIMGVPCSRVTAERRARVMKNMKLSDELFEELLVNYRSEAKGVSRPRIPRTTAPSPESESGRNRYTSSPPPRPSRVRTKPIDSERTGRAIESQRSRPTESETIRNLRREIAAVDAEIDQFDDAFYQAHEDGNVLQERCDDLEAAGTTQTGLAEVTHDIALIQKVNQVFMDFDAKRIGAERAFGEVLQSLESYLRGRKEILGFEEVFGAGFGLVSASGFGSIGLRAISNSGIGLNSGRRRSERGEGDDEHIRKRQR